MSFLTTTLAKAAFKKSLGKAHTSNEKDLANEALPSSFTLSSKDIFADDIPALPSDAVAQGVALDCRATNALSLALDSTSNGKAYFVQVPSDPFHPLKSVVNPTTGLTYQTGDRVTRILPQFYGDRYRPVLRLNGDEIAPLASQNWYLDAFAGVLTSEVNLNLGALGTLDCYVYSGKMLNTAVDDLVLSGGSPGELAVYSADRQVAPKANLFYAEASDALQLRDGTKLSLSPTTSSHAVSLEASAELTGNVSFVLPKSDGVVGDVLQTDGSGKLYFGSVSVGTPEDGSYADGLFTDITPTTGIGVVVDRFNEVLKALAPPPAGSLSAISISNPAGAAAKLSFGASNAVEDYSLVLGTGAGSSALDINEQFAVSNLRRGVYARQAMSGVVQGGAAAHAYAYPANAFGDADQGQLQLEVNGVVLHSVNLASFISGSSLATSLSGFSLSAATPVKFQDGSSLDLFKYRTGTWTVSAADQRSGWNYVRVLHVIGGTTKATNYFEWVVDDETISTQFSDVLLHDLSLTGSRYLSGVRYYTAGSALYDVTIANAYRNTYSASLSAISHSGVNCSLAAQALPTMVSNTDSVVVTSKPVTIIAPNGRLLAADLSVATQVLRSVQATATSPTATGGWKILLDANTPAATDLYEDFKGEGYRQLSSLSLTSLGYASGPNAGAANWDSTSALTDGLLIYNGGLRYPKMGLANGNFKNENEGNAGGPTVPGGYADNPDYSGATGEKTYLRYFYTTTPRQNFLLNITASATNFVAATNIGSLNSNNLCLEILAPGLTKDASGAVVWKDCVTAYTTDAAVGAYAATFGNTIPTAWGITLGTKSTANSGFVVVLRITAPASWTGSLSSITMTLL